MIISFKRNRRNESRHTSFAILHNPIHISGHPIFSTDRQPLHETQQPNITSHNPSTKKKRIGQPTEIFPNITATKQSRCDEKRNLRVWRASSYIRCLNTRDVVSPDEKTSEKPYPIMALPFKCVSVYHKPY